MQAEARRLAINSFLGTNWPPGPGRLPFEFPNVKFDQPATGWIRVSIQEAGTLPASIGRTFKRTRGVLYFQIFTAADKGEKQAREQADLLAALFDHATINDASGPIQFQVMSARPVGGSGNMYQMTASVDFYHDHG